MFGPGGADLELACAMAEKLRHRGPDEAGKFLSADGRCAIGFRRLAVIDPTGSHQPMSDNGPCESARSGGLTVAFNGEIYNFRELRAALSAGGAVFRTAGEAEVLLNLYRRDGVEMFAGLVGMFALVLYDAARGRLVLARDRLGQKPLWYAALADRIVFASQGGALLGHPKVSRRLRDSSMAYYMTLGYVPAPRTIWRAAAKLRPGHYMLASESCGPAVRYWGPRPDQTLGPPDELTGRVRQAVTAAVETRMAADVPIGALLSGGVDSSIVVAAMSRAAGRVGGVRTFTAGFEDEQFDERPAAAEVARHCGTDHTELLVRAAPTEMLDELIAMFDEPFADSSALPTYLICRAARQHVTVALAGDGGDEVFAGYDRYRALQWAATMAPRTYLAVRAAAAVAGLWAPADERSRLRRLVRFTEALPHPPAVQYFMYRRLFGPDDLRRLFTGEFAERIRPDAPARWFARLYEQLDLDDEVTRAQTHDMLTYLPDDLLVKTDIASTASSLELRAPMLDHRVAALGLSLPLELKLTRRAGKIALRRAFANMLPQGLFNRPKRGFAVPLGRWLREDLREVLRETLLDESLRRRNIFRTESLAGLINDHLSGRDDHAHRLWAILVLARWLAKQK